MSSWYLDTTQLLAPLLFPGSVPPGVGVGPGGPVPTSLQSSQLALAAAAAAAHVGLAGMQQVGAHSSNAARHVTGQPGGATPQSVGPQSALNGVSGGPSSATGPKPNSQGPSSFHEQFKQVN